MRRMTNRSSNSKEEKSLSAFPQFLNEPERLVYWTIGEALIFLTPILLIGLFGMGLIGLFSLPLGIIVGYFGFFLFRFLSNTKRGGDLRAGLEYWYFPSKKYHPFPPSHIRRYTE